MFALYTWVSPIVAIFSGVIYAYVMLHLRPFVTAYAASFMIGLLFVFWLGPIAIQRLLTPALFEDGLHSLGVMFLAVLFTASMGVTMALVKRRNEP